MLDSRYFRTPWPDHVPVHVRPLRGRAAAPAVLADLRDRGTGDDIAQAVNVVRAGAGATSIDSGFRA